MPQGAFVYTSNVDGQFQRAAFDGDRILEVHGSIDRLQCTADCGVGVFSADSTEVTIDEKTMRAEGHCRNARGVGRWRDPISSCSATGEWDDTITSAQRSRLHPWLETLRGSTVVVVECGAGTAIPTVRDTCEDLARQLKGTLIRINPHEFEVPRGQINFPPGAMEGLLEIQRILELDDAQ